MGEQKFHSNKFSYATKLFVAFIGKSKSLFSEISTGSCKSSFPKFFIFFPHKIFVPKSTF